MKTLYRLLTAALFTLCLGMTALADLLPIPPEPETKRPGPLVPILIIALAVIAAAVLAVVIRRRQR